MIRARESCQPLAGYLAGLASCRMHASAADDASRTHWFHTDTWHAAVHSDPRGDFQQDDDPRRWHGDGHPSF
jgi:hypothetical protein